MQIDAKQVEEIVNQILQQMSDSGCKTSVNANPTDGEYDQLGTGGLEPFDKDYGAMDVTGKKDLSPFPRINRMLNRVKDLKETIDDERAVLVTEAYKLSEGEPQVIRCAKALAHVLKNVSVRIYPDELLVGEIGCPARNAPIFPEFSYDWIVDEILNHPFEQRRGDKFWASEKTLNNLLEIKDYWKGGTVQEQVLDLLTEEEKKGAAGVEGSRPVFLPNLFLYGGIGHLTPRYQVLLAQGFKGLKERIEEKMAGLDRTVTEDIEKREFYTAQLIVLDGVKEYFMKFARLAREMAQTESDAQRKQELLKIGDNCEWVSENPPRNFWEAMQLYILATEIVSIESNGHSISYGRFDQLLYPFYENDMKNGNITKKFVAEIIECFCIKVWEGLKLRDYFSAILNAEAGIGGPCLVVGGVDKEGKDATNDLSYLMLEAHAHTHTPDPWLASRWHPNMPWEFKVKLINVIKVGTGQPKLFNDEVIIPGSLSAGRTLEESRDYTVVGCVEPDSGGREYGAHDSNYFSLGRVFELAINDGRCIDCHPECPRFSKCGAVGGRLGASTGSLLNFKSFDEVKKAYEIQMEYWVDRMVSFINATEIAHRRLKPLPYVSLLIEDCIDKGKDVMAGGAKYNFSGPQAVGSATVGDGMCTIKQLIFEEKRLKPEDLFKALKNNWQGYETLYRLVNSDKVHHFGNDDDYADELTKFATDVYCANVEKHKNSRGGKILPGVYCASGNVGVGLIQGASPDGRLAQEPVSNCAGPVHTAVGCHDVKGPTAMIKSVAKLNHVRCTNGSLLNVRFTPSCVSGETGRDNFIRFVDTYFQRKGMHCQFNIVKRETLLDAKAHPENYPWLLVRVAGYSAFFVRLSEELQNDLIGRNEYSSFD